MNPKHRELIDRMTLKEKCEATVMENGRCFVIERLGQEGFVIKDNPRGDEDYMILTEEERKTAGYLPVAFPQAAAQAASWDPAQAEEIGRAMGRECRHRGITVLLRPGANIKRSPLCGRNFEYYSEDPVLAGKLAGAFIRGVQSQHTAADLKHFAVNSQEFERMTTNAVVSERALRELYLKPFEIAIKEGNPWTIMTSYNRVNGQWVPANPDVIWPVRKEFGFDGAFISDAMAVQTEKVASHRNGLDFEIGQRGVHTRELQEAVENGSLPESVLDDCIDRLLTLLDRTGQGGPAEKVAPETDHARARELAADGLVLLKNDGHLPIKKGIRAAVIGCLAEKPNYMGCGSGHMNGWKIDSTLEEMKKLGTAEFTYAPAYSPADRPSKESEGSEELVREAVETAEAADLVLFFTGLPTGYESEGYDRQSLELPGDQKSALEAVLRTGKPVVIVNVSGSAVNLAPFADRAAGILHGYLAGEAIGGALADVLCGIKEPGGRLPETFPMRLADTPAFMSFPHYPQEMQDVLYGEDIFVGYRWYEKREIKVLFPFGAGLSYTSFDISGIHAEEKGLLKEEDEVTVIAEVANTGSREGSTVLQLYAGKPDSQFIGPVKELKGFAKVRLAPGERKKVSIRVPVKDLARWHEGRHVWVVEPGVYEFRLGTSSEEICAVVKAEVAGSGRAHVYKGIDAVEWYMKSGRREEALQGLSETAVQALSPEGVMADLIGALPVYRMAEGSGFGPAAFTPEELALIEDRLNS